MVSTPAMLRARELLSESGPHTPPIDPARIADHLGLVVRHATFNDPTISGALRDGTIYVNYNDLPTRQRFTIAHEIGHAVLHSTEAEPFVDLYRSSVSSLGTNQLERDANAFAAELLMPEDLLTRYCDLIEVNPDELAAIFQVSPQAMRNRLNNLRLR